MRSAICLSRLVRGLWPDRNPLRRRCDRAEAAITAALLATFSAGVPIAALAAGNWFYAMAAILLLALLLLGAGMAARRALDRRRLGAWEADWSVTGPRWTSRRLLPSPHGAGDGLGTQRPHMGRGAAFAAHRHRQPGAARP